MATRREFLKTSSLVALAPTVPVFLQRAARATEPGPNDRILVVVQLDGGNDGINTLIPLRDEGYALHRKQLRVPEDRVLKLTGDVGLHPSMRAAAELFESGRLAVVQGVGYPNPSRSHDVSMAIWHTARFDRRDHKQYGWIGRALDEPAVESRGAGNSVFVANQAMPMALTGRRSAGSSLTRLDELMVRNEAPRTPLPDAGAGGDLAAFVQRTALDAYATAEVLAEIARRPAAEEAYPASELGNQLKLVSQLIKAPLPARVYYAAQGGYDTHAVQLPVHARLLRELSDAMAAFLNDLRRAQLDQRVVVMCFSEFGRRVAENASVGTDHGTAGPVLVAGAPVRAGLHGSTPSLTDLIDGDVKTPVDFRQVYATLLEDWLGLPSEAALDGRFEKLGIL
ncbi:MAG: DUF1501 domain-containing protein [Pirellulales bacterium]